MGSNVFNGNAEDAIEIFLARKAQIGVGFRWPNVARRHRLNRLLKLTDYRLRVAASFDDIPLLPPCQANRVFRIDKDLGLGEFSELGPIKGEQAFQDQECIGPESFRLWYPPMRREIVNGLLYLVALTELLNVSDEEPLIDGSGGVEVYPDPFAK